MYNSKFEHTSSVSFTSKFLKRLRSSGSGSKWYCLYSERVKWANISGSSFVARRAFVKNVLKKKRTANITWHDWTALLATCVSTYFVWANLMWSTDLNCFHLLVKLMAKGSPSSLLGCISMNVRSCKYSPLKHSSISINDHSFINPVEPPNATLLGPRKSVLMREVSWLQGWTRVNL